MAKRNKRKSARELDPNRQRELQKYENPIPSREYILQQLAESGAPLQHDELASLLELESDVAGTEFNPVYIMNIQGYSETTLEQLEQAVSGLSDIDVTISPVETLIG